MDLICVKMVAPFELRSISTDGEIAIPAGTSLLMMLLMTGAPLYALAMPVVVNGKQESKSYCLQDGDIVVFVMPFSGG